MRFRSYCHSCRDKTLIAFFCLISSAAQRRQQMQPSGDALHCLAACIMQNMKEPATALQLCSHRLDTVCPHLLGRCNANKPPRIHSTPVHLSIAAADQILLMEWVKDIDLRFNRVNSTLRNTPNIEAEFSREAAAVTVIMSTRSN